VNFTLKEQKSRVSSPPDNYQSRPVLPGSVGSLQIRENDHSGGLFLVTVLRLTLEQEIL
jgi:hypothetical protein